MQSNKHLVRILTVQDLKDALVNLAALVEAVARSYVETLEANPGFFNQCVAEGIDPHLLWRLERMGRGQVHRDLVLSPWKAVPKLITLPLSEQTRVLEQGVQVLDWDEESERCIPASKLDHDQIRQVIHKGSIRSIAEQRTWIRKQKQKVPMAQPGASFHVYKDHVVTTCPGKWSRSLILQWLNEMG